MADCSQVRGDQLLIRKKEWEEQKKAHVMIAISDKSVADSTRPRKKKKKNLPTKERWRLRAKVAWPEAEKWGTTATLELPSTNQECTWGQNLKTDRHRLRFTADLAGTQHNVNIKYLCGVYHHHLLCVNYSMLTCILHIILLFSL